LLANWPKDVAKTWPKTVCKLTKILVQMIGTKMFETNAYTVGECQQKVKMQVAKVSSK